MVDDIQTKREFQQILTAVWAIYSKELTKDVIKIYWHSLKQYEIDDIRKAISLHVQNPDNGQFTPKPADLIRVLSGSNSSAAMYAWSKVEKAIRRIGVWQSVIFDDAIIHAVIEDMGGWISLNNVTEKELPFCANEFEKRYQGYAMRGGVEDYTRKLTGRAEMGNTVSGHDSQSPILIGDKTKAETVFMNGVDGMEATGQEMTMDKLLALVPKRLEKAG